MLEILPITTILIRDLFPKPPISNFTITSPSDALREPKEFNIHSIYFTSMQNFQCTS